MRIIDYPELLQEVPVKITSCNAASVRQHKHAFFEFVYVCEGKAEHIFENKTVIIQKGDFFLINLDSSHEYHKIGEEQEFRVINCLFLPQFIDESLKDARCFQDILENYLIRYGTGRFDEEPTQKIFHDENGFIGQLVQNILREFEEKKVGYTDIIRNLLVTLILYLVRNETPFNGDPADRIIRDIKQYVGEHYMTPLHLSDICQKMNFSLPYISMLFRRECGITFRDYLIRTRIEKACLLLRSSSLPIQEIAYRVGYTDPAFFYKTFRREMNETPVDYRKRHNL